MLAPMTQAALQLSPPPRDPLARALHAIETRLFEPLSLAALAEAAGLSPYHFSRQFTARYGVSVMAHVRARRLAGAAAQLLEPNPPSLVQLAFDCGFDSQEGFTRAFKRAFGISPGRFRRGGGAPVPETRMPDSSDGLEVTLDRSPVSKPGFRVVGLERIFEEDEKHEIPKLWTQLFERMTPLTRRPGPTFGVCWGVGRDGAMGYMAGFALAADAPAPAALQVRTIPSQRYLVFRQRLDGGQVHMQMQAAARHIWGERLPALGAKLSQGPDLEVYPPDFRPDRAGASVEWWVPVQP